MCSKTYKTLNDGIGNLKTHYATHLKDPLDKVVPGKRKSQTVLLSASFNTNSTEVDIPDEPQILDHEPSCSKHSKVQQTLPSMVMNIKSTESGTKAEKITNAIAYYICKDNVPFKTVESEGFKHLMQTACLLYKIPCRNTIRRRIDDIYDVMYCKFKESLSKVNFIAVTTDAWTETMQMKSFLGITLHLIENVCLISRTVGTVELDESHTAQYIGRTLVETLASWGLEKHNVVAVVTDSGANIKKAIINEYTAEKHISCDAHTINLVVKKVIEKTQEINTETNIKSGGVPLLLSKVKKIVKFVKKSSKANDLLRKYQSIEGKKEGQYLKLILDVKTRWNISFYMIERFLKLTNYVSQMLLTFNGNGVPEMLSVHELRCLQDIYSLLKPFKILTRELSAKISVMSSKVIPIISGTRNEVLKQDPDIVIVMRLKIKLVEELDYRCGSYEQTPLLPICTLLDPLFKDKHFQNPLANSKAQEKIIQMMDNDNIVVNLALPTAESEESGNSDEPCDLWGLHKTLEQKQNDRSSFVNTSREELHLYLKQNILKPYENPLTEWENTKSVYPKLFKLAMKYLLIPATSVPSERLFSKAGDTIMSPITAWEKLQQNLHGEDFQQIYNDHFPIEVRQLLSPWFETKAWTEIDPDNIEHEGYIKGLFVSFVDEIVSKANSMVTNEQFVSKLKLIDTAKLYKEKYSQNPKELIRIIKKCLESESLMAQQNNSLMEVNVKSSQELENIEIMQQMELISNHVTHTNEIRMTIQSDIDSFNILYSECSKCTQHLQHMRNQRMSIPQGPEIERKLKQEKELYEGQLKTQSLSLNNALCVYINKLNESLNLLSPVQAHIIDKALIQWKREQQLAGNGYKYMKDIDVIQTWCEKLCDLMWITRSQIKEADRFRVNLGRYFELPQSCEIINTLLDMTTQYLSSLVASTFVIITQPPQVLKTNTRFVAEVRLLIGGKLNIHMTSPVVKVSIVSESQANQIIGRNKPDGESCGEILNCTGKMEYQPVQRHLSTNFRSMQLKKIKRTEKKGTESVMDEKFSILFSSKFFIGNELQFEVWNLSLPVVVIVHGNQDPHAWATVTWDNAFAEPGRVPFNVPDKVPWRNVAEALNMKFSAATGRGLSEESLTFLAEKAFRMQNVDFNHMVLSWSQFCKEPLPQRSFTFWEWFYAVMKITREHLKGPWTDGAIMGFIRKSDAEEMLTRYATGTFLLRFSDSELGGLTVAWAGSNDSDAYSLHPFSAKDLSIRNLADRLLDLPYLTKLYPDIDKNQAFGKYYTQPPNISTPVTSNGYLKPLLVTHVPGWGGPGTNGQGMNSYPNTPQNHMFHVNSPGNCSIRETSSVHSEPVNNMMAFGNDSLEMDFSSNLNDISHVDEAFF